MLAAALSPDSAISSPSLRHGTLLNRLTSFDDPQEWAVFSQACEPQSPGVEALWESQVLVRGMHCAACAVTLEEALLNLRGVVSARVSAASARASVVWSPTRIRPSEWLAAPHTLGYQLWPAPDAIARTEDQQATRMALWRWLVAGFCMMQVMMYAVPGYLAHPGDITPDIEKLLRWASWVLSLPVILFSCSPFFGSALRDIKRRTISMDLPVALGIAVTFSVSSAATFDPQGVWGQSVYFDSLTMFVFFLLTGRWLEQGLHSRTAGSLGALLQRLPDTVERQDAQGGFQRISARRLNLADVIRVLPGEAFPADGVILQGDTFADEALMTGESRPIARPAGSTVMAGSYNAGSVILMRVEHLGSATRYAQLVALMAQAATDKPRLAVLADRVAKPFLRFVLLAAAFAAAFWWNTDPAHALMAAVAVLVVTCPCALSLATPTAMLTTAGTLAKRGVLVRRLQAIEALAGIHTVIFDKTGTLTETSLSLRSVQVRQATAPALTETAALHIAASLAQYSLHPASRALVVAHAGTGFLNFNNVQSVAGFGLQGELPASISPAISGPLRLGSARHCGVDTSLDPIGDDALWVYLANTTGWLARFELGEKIRPNAANALAALRSLGLSVQILSGDRTGVVHRVASALGLHQRDALSDAQGDKTPQDKLAHLRRLQAQGRQVMMVGDGLNDGPVLAGADVSVAVGQAVPLAQAQCDFILPGGQLMMLPTMVGQARRTLRIVRQNLWWAAAYNAASVPLALAGWLPAWLAGLGMAASSLLVVGNAARLADPFHAKHPDLPASTPDRSLG